MVGLRRGDGTVTLQPGRVPDLCFHQGVSHHNGAGGELDSDGGATVMVELIASEAGKEVGLPDSGFSDQDHWDEDEKQGCCIAHARFKTFSQSGFLYSFRR